MINELGPELPLPHDNLFVGVELVLLSEYVEKVKRLETLYSQVVTTALAEEEIRSKAAETPASLGVNFMLFPPISRCEQKNTRTQVCKTLPARIVPLPEMPGIRARLCF